MTSQSGGPSGVSENRGWNWFFTTIANGIKDQHVLGIVLVLLVAFVALRFGAEKEMVQWLGGAGMAFVFAMGICRLLLKHARKVKVLENEHELDRRRLIDKAKEKHKRKIGTRRSSR